MSYQVKFAQETIDYRFLKKLPKTEKEKLFSEITLKLGAEPLVFGKPLRSSLKGFRRLRVGKLRVIYKIEQTVVKVYYIGRKPAVYEEFLKKLNS